MISNFIHLINLICFDFRVLCYFILFFVLIRVSCLILIELRVFSTKFLKKSKKKKKEKGTKKRKRVKITSGEACIRTSVPFIYWTTKHLRD